MPRSKESLNFLLVSSLLHIASKVLIQTVRSVTSRLNTTLEQLLSLHRHGFFHSWKTKECCQCDQSFQNSASILSSAEWSLLFQKTEEDCERAPNVECSCCFQANAAIDPDSLSINMASCILERAEGLEENELKNIRTIRDINDRLVQTREEATLTEDQFTSLSDDLNKALHQMSKQQEDDYYNDIVETIQKADTEEPDEEEARQILERFDQDNKVHSNTDDKKMRSLKLEYHRVDSMRSDISVCGSDEENPSESVDKMDEEDPLVLADSQILKDTDYSSVDLGDSDFDDEEEEENEYGKVLERMTEKFGYLRKRCVAVGKELSDVRQRLEGSWSVPETKAQSEEALRQELKEIEMMRKFIDTRLDDENVRNVYLPYEDFQITNNQGTTLESPYLKDFAPIQYVRGTIARPSRPTFASYTQLHSNKKQFSQSLSSISGIFKRNLRAASSWRLDPVPRKYDRGNMVTPLTRSDGNFQSSLPETSISRPGNKLEEAKDLDYARPTTRESTLSGFRIDYSKYEQCIKESEKLLENPVSAGKDKESILCERQHGHYLSQCEQRCRDLVKKCEALKQKIHQLKSRFDNCEQLLGLSENAELCENMTKEYEKDKRPYSEGKRTPVPSFRVKPEPSAKLMDSDAPYPRYASSLSIAGSQRQEMAFDMETGTVSSDDEESILERRFGNSLKKLQAECESLQQRCKRSKRDLHEARLQISSSQQDLQDYVRPESQFEDDLDEPDDELRDIKWKSDALNESFDSAYHTVTSGRSTGYSTRSFPNSRSPYRDSSTPSHPVSTPRRFLDDVSPSPSPRPLYSPGYCSDDGIQTEDHYRPRKITTPDRVAKRAPTQRKVFKATSLEMNTGVRDLYYNVDYEENTEDEKDVELKMENKHGEFLEQCKSNFLNISAKSLELKQEIRRLRVNLGLPTLKPPEREVSSLPKTASSRFQHLRVPKLDVNLGQLATKESSYKTVPRRPDFSRPHFEDDVDESEITSYEKDMSVAEQSYGNFLSNMKSNYDSLNEKSMRTKQEILALRRSLLNPALQNNVTCGNAYRQSYSTIPMEMHGY